jgi:hypothetical protein
MSFRVLFGHVGDDGIACRLPPHAPTTSIELSLCVEPADEHRAGTWAFGSCFPAATLSSKQGRSSFGSVALAAKVARVTPNVVRPPNGCFYLTLLVEVPHGALETFEAHRGETPEVEIQLMLNLTLFRASDTEGRAVLGEPHWVPDGSELVGASRTFSRDEWHRILRDLGFAEVLVFELPRRIVGDSGTALQTARAELEKARRAYDENRTDDVAQHAYLALDALAPGQGQIIDRIAKDYLVRLHPETLARLRAALIALMPTIQVGRHMAGTAQQPAVPITREHASWIYGTAALIVGWCGSLRR